MKEKLSVKWDRWQSTDKGREKEKEQKEKSSMMQTCDKKLQSEEKQQSPRAEGVSQQCRQCICASPRREPGGDSRGKDTAASRRAEPRAQVQLQSLQLLGLSRKGAAGSGSSIPASVQCGAPRAQTHSSITSKPLKIPHPPGKGKVKTDYRKEKTCLNHK